MNTGTREHGNLVEIGKSDLPSLVDATKQAFRKRFPNGTFGEFGEYLREKYPLLYKQIQGSTLKEFLKGWGDLEFPKNLHAAVQEMSGDPTRRRFMQQTLGATGSLMADISIFIGTIVPIEFQKSFAERAFVATTHAVTGDIPSYGWTNGFLLSAAGYPGIWSSKKPHEKLGEEYDAAWARVSRNGAFQDLCREVYRKVPDFPVTENWFRADDSKKRKIVARYGIGEVFLENCKTEIRLRNNGKDLMGKIVNAKQLLLPITEKVQRLVNLLEKLPVLIQAEMKELASSLSYSSKVADFITLSMRKNLILREEKIEQEIKEGVQSCPRFDNHYHEEAIIEERVRKEKMNPFREYSHTVSVTCKEVVVQVRELLGELTDKEEKQRELSKIEVSLAHIWGR